MEQSDKYSYCHIVERTDVGCKRPANEDSMGHFDTVNGRVAVVCDGMGGHVGGATASRIAVDAIHAFLDSKFIESPQEAIGCAIDAANAAILRQAAARPELIGMGSTCVLLLIRDGLVYRGHVGDSRIYLIRNRIIQRLTRDDSYVQMLVDMQKLTEEEAEHHPRKNEITNALGLPDMKPATVAQNAIVPEAGDCFLLCSDGLTGMVSERDIERIVSRQQELTSQQRADMLVERAKENGGLDNITVQLVEFSLTPDQHDGSLRKPSRKGWIIGAVVLACCIVAGAGLYFLKGEKSDRQETENKEGQQQMPEIRQRKCMDYVLTDVPFVKNAEILHIEYDDKETVIMKDENRLRTLPGPLSPDSLKCESQVQIDNNRILIFNDKFVGDTLRFSLSDSVAVYRVKVPVKHLDNGRNEETGRNGSKTGRTGKGQESQILEKPQIETDKFFDDKGKKAEEKDDTPNMEGTKGEETGTPSVEPEKTEKGSAEEQPRVIQSV